MYHLSRLPPHPTHPPRPTPHILPLQDPIHRKPLARQLLITRHAMHKAMARTTQPRHAIQHPLLMPALLAHLVVHPARNQMVIRQRDPVAPTDLARLRPRRRPYRRRPRHGPDVLAYHAGEEIRHVTCVAARWEEAVYGQRVGD